MKNILLSIILTGLLLFSQTASALDTKILAEAQDLEINGEPLSAQMEYTGLLTDTTKEYLEKKDPAFNLAASEFLLEKILELSKFTGELQDPLETIKKVNTGELPPTLQSRLTLAEITLKKLQGNSKEVADLTGQLNFIDNIYLQNTENNEIIHIKSIAPDRSIPLGSILGSNESSMENAYIIIKAKGNQQAALRFGSSVPLEIDLNSYQILKTVSERNALADQQSIGLQLHDGINLLRLKFKNKDSANFYLRLTAPDGSQLNNANLELNSAEELTQEQLREISNKARTAEPPVLPAISTGAEQQLAYIFSNDNTNHIAAYFLGYLLLTRETLADTPQAPRHLLLTAARYSPDTAIYLIAIARASDESKRFIADREENMKRMSLEKAIKLDPENILARAELAQYYLNSQNSPQRAETYITEALKINPIAVITNIVRYDIYKARGWESRALQVAREMARRDPQNPIVQRILGHAGIDSTTIDDSLAAFKSSYSTDAANSTTAINIFRLLMRKDQITEAKAFARQYLELEPYNSKIREEYLQLLLTTRDKDALSAIENARKLFPKNAGFTRLLGDYYAETGNEQDKALNCYKEALSYNPADIELLRYLEFRGIHKKSPLKQIKNLQEYVATVSKDRIPTGSDKVYILSEKYDHLNLGGTRSRTAHMVIKTLTKKGAEVLKRYPIWFDSDTEQTHITISRVIHPDGSTSQSQNSVIRRDGGKNIALIDFPALDAGDIIEIEYTVAQTKPNFFGSYFGNINLFSNTIPVLESRYILTFPVSEKLYFNTIGDVPEPAINRSDAEITYTWSLKDLPAITLNPNSPPINELSPTVEVSTFKDWDSLARWYWNLIRDQNQPTPEIEAKVKELTMNAKSDREKLEAIYNWVTAEVRNNAWEFGVHGYKPYNAGTIFTRRFGDCKDKSTLINVMAKLAGIESWPLLLRSTQSNNVVKGRGKEDFRLPLLSHFNHCISYAEVDGTPYFLDGTMMFRTIDSNPSTDAGATAVIIRPDGAEMTETPAYSADSNRWIDYSGIGINAEGTADMDFTIATTGESSMYMRAWFSNHQTWDNVLRAVCTERYGHVSAGIIEDFGTNDGLDKDEVMLKGRVRIRGYAQKNDNKELTFNIPRPLLSRTEDSSGSFPQELSTFAITSQRSTDLILPTLYKVERHLKIEWPANWELLEKMPEDVSIDKPFGRLSMKFSRINNTLKLDYIMELKKIRITSAEYTDFRDFCFKADLPVRTNFTLRPEKE